MVVVFVSIKQLCFCACVCSCGRVQEGRWNDSPCNLTLPSICKKPGTKSEGKTQQKICKKVSNVFTCSNISPACAGGFPSGTKWAELANRQ